MIPLDLDGYLFNRDSGKASILKSRLVADFTLWERDQTKFDEQIGSFVNALRADSGGRKPPPSRNCDGEQFANMAELGDAPDREQRCSAIATLFARRVIFIVPGDWRRRESRR